MEFVCLLPSLLESVIVTEFQAKELFSNLCLTKTQYSASRGSMLEKQNMIASLLLLFGSVV
jgi:hypothetical protein